MLSVFIYFYLYIKLTVLKIPLVEIYFESVFIILLPLYNTILKNKLLLSRWDMQGGLLWRAVPAGEANETKGAKPKLFKFGFLLSYTREWHMKPRKEEKPSRNGDSFREPGNSKKGRKGNSSMCNEKYSD